MKVLIINYPLVKRLRQFCFIFKRRCTIKNKHRINFFKQEDYRRTVTEIDEKEYISLKIIVSELRNQYVCCGLHYLSASIYTRLHSESRITDMFACFQVTLHDMILKNIEKIKRPRSSNADALYWCSSSCLCIHPPTPRRLLPRLFTMPVEQQ